MTSGAVWKVILRFAFPLLIGNLLQQLYNVTDSVIVGQFLGKESLAAVSASFFIYYFIISLVIGIGSGTSVVISQFFGAKEFDKVQKAFSSFFIFMLVAGVLLSIAGIIFAEPMFRLTNTPEDVIPQAVAYFRIYVGGTFLFVTFNSIISILRGVGESVRPMLFILLTTILNIALDLLFIVVFKWGIEGAARATVIAKDRHVRGPRLREQHPSPALYQETGFIVRYGTVQGRAPHRASLQRTAMCHLARIDCLTGDREQFRHGYAHRLRGSGKDRHDHHPSGIDPLWGASCFLRAKHRSWALGPGT